jgi:hypothetical protein
MSVVIIRENERTIYVNTKLVILDQDNNWKALEELTSSESKSFYEYINSENLSMENRLN